MGIKTLDQPQVSEYERLFGARNNITNRDNWTPLNEFLRIAITTKYRLPEQAVDYARLWALRQHKTLTAKEIYMEAKYFADTVKMTYGD